MTHRGGSRVAGFALPDDRQLFLAAPELLSALQNLLGYIEATDDDIDHTEMCLNTGDAVLNAEAAIAQATGQMEFYMDDVIAEEEIPT